MTLTVSRMNQSDQCQNVAEDWHVDLLSLALFGHMGDQYEERVLRIMVQEELSPITEQIAAVDLAQSFCEIFKCMYSPSLPLCVRANSFDSRLQMTICSLNRNHFVPYLHTV